ncbi:MAG: hypothetical protein ABSG53_31420, partial [Thermoguttaceae bacterium]
MNTTPKDHRNRRFLCLWFSHPLFDWQGIDEVTLLDTAGKPIPLGEDGTIISRIRSAEEINGPDRLGWLTYTTSWDTDSPTVTVRLRYTLGPLERTREVDVTPNNFTEISLEGGSRLKHIGENSDGHAFVAIVVDTAGTKDRSFGVVAVTKDGRELKSGGIGDGNAVRGLRTGQFTFEASLSDITKFRIGTRPIRTVEFKNVPTQAKPASPAAAVAAGQKGNEQSPRSSDFDFSVVVARHVMLLDGREIVTWPQIEEKLAKHAYPSPAHPGFYDTRGALEAGLYEPAQQEMHRLNHDYKFAPYGAHVMSDEGSFRYDRIRTPDDLKLDESARTEGIVVTPEARPVVNAEVILVTPIDKSIPYGGSTYGIQLEHGRVNWPLDHVITRSNAAGRFTVYPPKGQAFCIVALHSDSGIGLLNGKPAEAVETGNTLRKLTLAPWAGVNCDISKESENQDAILRSFISLPDNLPTLIFDQSMGAATKQQSTLTFRCTQVPPGPQTVIYRVLFGGFWTGGTRILTGATVELLPGETRQISLGPVSKQSRELLQQIWSMEMGTPVQPAPGAEKAPRAENAAGPNGAAAGTSPTTPRPDIGGKWQSRDWGQITLAQDAPGQYTATYTRTVGQTSGPGKIRLKWSPSEYRYKGTWRESDDRFGALSIWMADNEIRGALTTDAKSKVNPATPRLADLVWMRAEVAIGQRPSVGHPFQSQVTGGDVELFGGTSIPAATLHKMEGAFGKAGLNNYTLEGGRVKVSRAQRAAYLAALVDARALPPNFADLLNEGEDGSPFDSPKQREDRLRLRKQEEMSMVINCMHDIESAHVIIDQEARSEGFDLTPPKTAVVEASGTGGN